MNYNKKIIIAIGIFFSVLLIGLSIIHIAINFIYPGNELAESIKENFKDSFGKSIKFDSLIFKYNGDIILQNFYLSNTTDFNDNVNLIKCNEVVVDTDLLDLFREKTTFSAVIMYKPEIDIIKNYGKSYTDTFITDIISGIKKDKVSQFISRKFSIELIDSKLYYREIFKKSKTAIDIYDVDIDIDYYGNELEYEIDGKIANNNISWWRSCGFEAEGSFIFDESKAENSIEFKNIDLSLLNNLLIENYKEPLLFKGELSGDITISSDKDKVDLKGKVKGNDIYASAGDDPDSGFILKDEDVTVKADVSALSSLSRVRVNNLTFDDDVIELELNSEYIKDEQFTFVLKSNKIDLSDLSMKFIPVQKCSYNGELSLNGKLKYNLKDMKPEEMSLDVKLNQFNLIPAGSPDYRLQAINNCNALIAADKEKYILKARFDTGRTDIDMSLNGQISEWNPFKSKNQLDVSSKKLELSLIKKAVMAGVNSIYDMAYVDMFQNFDEQKNFLKEPEGIFINNNDLSLSIKADKIVIENNAALNNFNLKINLEKGNIKTGQFELEGYDGVFKFDALATLRQEYPFIKIEGSVQNLNISKISVDSDSAIKGGGVLSSDFKFETNAFRIGQIVENGKASLNLDIKDGYFSGEEKLLSLDKFIKSNGYQYSIPDPLTFSSLTFSFMQSSNEYYIRSFSLSGNKCSFSAYGQYIEEDGLNIPLNLNFFIENGGFVQVPLLIYGKLLSPCVKINDKKKPDSICF